MGGHPDTDLGAVTLTAGATSITVLTRVGLTVSSLDHRGEQYLSLHGGVAALRGGHTTGLPLLAPWANRLRGPDYVVDDRRVAVVGSPGVHLDANGLPLHGTMVGRDGWSIEQRDASSLTAVFDAAADPEVMASFPFPHSLTVRFAVEPARLTVTTTLRATGAVAVPVSFGWHPYFTLPGSERDDWWLELPDRLHLLLDELQLPTGAVVDEPAGRVDLLGRALDDGYLLGTDRRLALCGPDHRLEVALDGAYPVAQVYAPIGSPFVALEPMTAPTDALSRAQAATVAPGHQHTAGFVVTIV